jgi:CPA1 family monovalent cation:H+ antiporter
VWSTFDSGALLLVFATVVAIVNDHTLRLPRPIAMLVAALAASAVILAVSALVPGSNLAGLTERRLVGADLPDVLLNGVLALLLFATSLRTDLAGLRRHARPIFWLATLGVAIAMLVFGIGIHAVLRLIGIDIPLAWCLVLGAILAPTDAVVVEQLVAKVNLPADVKALISGESLFNDGAAVVFFFAALATATGADTPGHGHIVLQLLIEGFGGALLGFIAGLLARQAMRFSRDPNIAVTISLALVLATYRSATLLELSGPIAVVVAGLTMRNWPVSARAAAPWRRRISQLWSMVDELVNTLLFLLMGFEVLTIPLGTTSVIAILCAIPLSLAARLASVTIPLAFARSLPRADRLKSIGVLTWTGLRGGISIALVLGLPDSPYRETLAVICYALVIFSVVVQGLTTPAVVSLIYGAGAPGTAGKG